MNDYGFVNSSEEYNAVNDDTLYAGLTTEVGSAKTFNVLTGSVTAIRSFLQGRVQLCDLQPKYNMHALAFLSAVDCVLPNGVAILRFHTMEHSGWQRNIAFKVLIGACDIGYFEPGIPYYLDGNFVSYRTPYIEGKVLALSLKSSICLKDLDLTEINTMFTSNIRLLSVTATNRCVLKGTVYALKNETNRVKLGVKFENGTVNCMKLSKDDVEVGKTYYFIGNVATFPMTISKNGGTEDIDVYQLWCSRIIPDTTI